MRTIALSCLLVLSACGGDPSGVAREAITPDAAPLDAGSCLGACAAAASACEEVECQTTTCLMACIDAGGPALSGCVVGCNACPNDCVDKLQVCGRKCGGE